MAEAIPSGRIAVVLAGAAVLAIAAYFIPAIGLMLAVLVIASSVLIFAMDAAAPVALLIIGGEVDPRRARTLLGSLLAAAGVTVAFVATAGLMASGRAINAEAKRAADAAVAADASAREDLYGGKTISYIERMLSDGRIDDAASKLASPGFTPTQAQMLRLDELRSELRLATDAAEVQRALVQCSDSEFSSFEANGTLPRSLDLPHAGARMRTAELARLVMADAASERAAVGSSRSTARAGGAGGGGGGGGGGFWMVGVILLCFAVLAIGLLIAVVAAARRGSQPRESIRRGMTTADVLRILGHPQAVSQHVTKTRVGETWKYGHVHSDRFELRVNFEDGVVVGWKQI